MGQIYIYYKIIYLGLNESRIPGEKKEKKVITGPTGAYRTRANFRIYSVWPFVRKTGVTCLVAFLYLVSVWSRFLAYIIRVVEINLTQSIL